MDAASRAAKAEIIGLQATVVASGHAPLVGTAGRVVDETAQTFVLATEAGREIVVPKKGQRFALDTPSGRVEIDGAALANHPVERIKRNR